MSPRPSIFIACDTSDMKQCKNLATLAQSYGQGIKLGLEFFCANGPQGLRTIRDRHPDLPIFLDLKLHDIPNTVGAAMRSLCASITPAYITVHASGGCDMIRAARDNAPVTVKVLAVTVLTSLDAAALKAVGQDSDYQAQAVRLGKLAQASAADGIVCAAPELATMRNALGNDFVCMVPGIRPASTGHDDQKRISTPAAAILAGASHLVIGRPITRADDPDSALSAICREIEEAANAATG